MFIMMHHHGEITFTKELGIQNIVCRSYIEHDSKEPGCISILYSKHKKKNLHNTLNSLLIILSCTTVTRKNVHRGWKID